MFDDLDPGFNNYYDSSVDTIMTCLERLYALCKAEEYIHNSKIDGAIVECGGWKDESSMLMAKMSKDYYDVNKDFYLYDTFEGMSEPSEADKTHTGEQAMPKW